MRTLILAVLALGSVTEVHGSTLYSNIGGGFPSDAPGSYNGSSFAVFGSTFTTTAGGNLATISTFLISSFATPSTGGLYTDVAGEPGTLLESWTIPTPTTAVLTTLSSVLHPLLSSGTQYWFVWTSFPTPFVLAQNDTGATEGIWGGGSLTGLSDLGGLSPGIELTSDSSVAAPEPATGLLFLSGALIMFPALRRCVRHRQSKSANAGEWIKTVMLPAGKDWQG